MMTRAAIRLLRIAARRLCAPAIATTALALACAAPAAAASAGLVVIPRPAVSTDLSYFKLSLLPAQAGPAGVIELRNSGSRRVRAELRAVDGQTLSTLGSTYAPAGLRVHGATRWLIVARRKVGLAPGASVRVPVSVRVPAGARPGDYLSGVSVEALGQGAAKAKGRRVSIASAVRYAIGVEVSLPGPRRPLIRFVGARLERQPRGLVFLLRARNLGNVILQNVRGGALVTHGRRTVARLPLGPGTFVTRTSIAYPVAAYGEHPAAGRRYRVRAWMRYQGGIARLDTLVSFGHRQAVLQRQYSHPHRKSGGTAWWKIAGVGALGGYALLSTFLLLRRRRRAQLLAKRPAEDAAGGEHSGPEQHGSQPV